MPTAQRRQACADLHASTVKGIDKQSTYMCIYLQTANSTVLWQQTEGQTHSLIHTHKTQREQAHTHIHTQIYAAHTRHLHVQHATSTPHYTTLRYTTRHDTTRCTDATITSIPCHDTSSHTCIHIIAQLLHVVDAAGGTVRSTLGIFSSSL